MRNLLAKSFEIGGVIACIGFATTLDIRYGVATIIAIQLAERYDKLKGESE